MHSVYCVYSKYKAVCGHVCTYVHCTSLHGLFVCGVYLELCCFCFLSSFVSSHVELKFERYKFIVQVVIGEQRGEGVK